MTVRLLFVFSLVVVVVVFIIVHDVAARPCVTTDTTSERARHLANGTPLVFTAAPSNDDEYELNATDLAVGRRLSGDDAPTISSPFIVIHRTKRSYPDPVLVLSKGFFLVKRSQYTPEDGDEIAPWTIEHKSTTNLTELTYPLLIRCFDGSCAAPFGAKSIYRQRYVVAQGNLTEILEHPDVLYVESIRPIKFTSLDALEVMYDPTAPTDPDQRASLGKGVIIAISDTGLDYYHAAFYDASNPTPRLGNLHPYPAHSKVASYVTAIPGYTDYACENGCHGTSVVGAAVGFATALDETGNAPGARVAFYDMSPNNQDSIQFIDESLIQYLLDICDPEIGGATVVSASWGSTDTTGVYDSLSEIFDELAALRPNCSFTFACGNDGPTGKCSSPSNSKNGDSVGASFSRPEAYPFWASAATHPDRYTLRTAAAFSSTGPLPDGRMAPLFYAPGVYEYLPYGYETRTNNHLHYSRVSGTSFSCPHLAGTKAEIQRRYRELNQNNTPSSELVRAILITLSEPMNGNVMQVHPVQGALPLSSHPSVHSYGAPRLPQLDLSLGGISVTGHLTESNPKRAYCFTANRTDEPVVVGASWLDVPGPTLVNDLDFRVFANHTSVYPIYYDGVNNHDRMEVWVSPNDTVARVLVYETDGVIQGDQQTFALHFTNVAQVYACGTCAGFETLPCGNNGSGARVCNVTDGHFTSTCFESSDSANATVDEFVACSDALGTGFRTDDTTCQHTVCAPGFYLVSVYQCGCVPGTETPCGDNDGGHEVKQCTPGGTGYSTCYSKFSTEKPAGEQSSIQSQVRSEARSLNQMTSPLNAAIWILLLSLTYAWT